MTSPRKRDCAASIQMRSVTCRSSAWHEVREHEGLGHRRPVRAVRLLYTKSLYDPRIRMRASARWIRFALAFALALGLAVVGGAAQRPTILTNGRHLQTPINHGPPDKQLGFTFCRLRYQNIRRARKSGWGDDYPEADYNFMVRLAELTTTTISEWNNGYPGFANVTAMDPDL